MKHVVTNGNIKKMRANESKSKRVEVFELDMPDQRHRYEALLNDPSVQIYKEDAAFIKSTGIYKITVWYLKEN